MPALPAICDNPKCGTVFPSSIFVENCTAITFTGSDGGRCPKCGSIGRIADGTYNVIAESISVLLQNESDLAVLEKMKAIVKSAIKEKNFKKAKKELSSIGPNWKNAFNILPVENIGNALALYMFVLAMIQTAIALYALSKPSETNILIDQSYEYFYNESPRIQQEERQEESMPFQMKLLTKAIKRNVT